jgi:hypothetical protein
VKTRQIRKKKSWDASNHQFSSFTISTSPLPTFLSPFHLASAPAPRKACPRSAPPRGAKSRRPCALTHATCGTASVISGSQDPAPSAAAAVCTKGWLSPLTSVGGTRHYIFDGSFELVTGYLGFNYTVAFSVFYPTDLNYRRLGVFTCGIQLLQPQPWAKSDASRVSSRRCSSRSRR